MQQSQSQGLRPVQQDKVILGQALSIITCGIRTHTEVTVYD